MLYALCTVHYTLYALCTVHYTLYALCTQPSLSDAHTVYTHVTYLTGRGGVRVYVRCAAVVYILVVYGVSYREGRVRWFIFTPFPVRHTLAVCAWRVLQGGDSYKLHVRNIGVDGWDGSDEGRGTFENEESIKEIFSQVTHASNFISCTLWSFADDSHGRWWFLLSSVAALIARSATGSK
jgi:hypothetical protein